MTSSDNGDVIIVARSGSIKDASAKYGISERSLRNLARQYPKILKRLGGSTLCDFAEIDRALDALPTTLQAPTNRKKTLRHGVYTAGAQS